jgi:hypothetical protein
MVASNEYLLGLLGKSSSSDQQPGIFGDPQTSEIQAIWELAEARRDAEGVHPATERRKQRSLGPGTNYERVKEARKPQPAWRGLNPTRPTMIAQEPKLLNWQAEEEIPETGGRKEGKVNPMTERRKNRSGFGQRVDQAEPEPRVDGPWADVFERQTDGSLRLVSENSPDGPIIDPERSQAKTDALTQRRKGRSLPRIG